MKRDKDREPSETPSVDVPAVSVIIPAYDCVSFIEETLRSVFSQTFTDYEVILVNDGAPDTEGLERLLLPHRHRIVYLKTENRGLAAARNQGIRLARGSLIALLDADDLWDPEYLKVQVAILRDNPEIDVLYPDAVIFGDTLDAGRTIMDLCRTRGPVTFERLVTQECNVQVHVTARREAIVRAGMFDEALRRGAEDFDLWLRMLHHGGRIAYHRRPLVHYRRRRDSLSSDTVAMFLEALRVLDKLHRTIELSASERSALENGRRLFLAELHRYCGKKAFLQGDFAAATDRLSQSNRASWSFKMTITLAMLRLAPGLLLRAYRLRQEAARENRLDGSR